VLRLYRRRFCERCVCVAPLSSCSPMWLEPILTRLCVGVCRHLSSHFC
jgi:hypothetical protein